MVSASISEEEVGRGNSAEVTAEFRTRSPRCSLHMRMLQVLAIETRLQ